MDYPSLSGLLASDKVTVGGVEFTVRALASAESRAVQDAFDTVVPPLMKDPTKGSAAAPLRNYDDPAFLKADRERSDLVTSAWFAVATGYTHNGKRFEEVPKAERGQWVKGAAEALEQLLPDGVKKAVVDRSRELGRLGKGVEAALGNSPAPQQPE